jgi:hypothetical protein
MVAGGVLQRISLVFLSDPRSNLDLTSSEVIKNFYFYDQ